jgi:hypothetical protein
VSHDVFAPLILNVPSWQGFDRFQLAGLMLICLKNETKASTERDLRDLIFPADTQL